MLRKKVFDLLESEVRSYPRSFPCILDRARGTELVDVNGRRYLDFLAGAGSLNYGHNNPALKSALLDYIGRDGITHSLDLHTAAKERFIEAMWGTILKPRNLDYVIQFTGPTGTNAVEAAMKLARNITGRTNIIAFTNGFHGVSLGALAATGNKYNRRASGTPLQGTTVMPYDGYCGKDIDTVEYMQRMLDDPSSGIDLPAAVILECVQGEGGLNVARPQWLRRLKALCEARDILFIVDDIQAGCGRTGTFFSFEEAGIQPDIVTLSKSLSGYGLPMSVVLIKREYDIWKPGEHNGTFRGNNHAFVTAAAAIEQYWQTTEFSHKIAAKGEYLRRRLQRMESRFAEHVTDSRGKGMMRGLVCADPAQAAQIAERAFANGLIIERCGPHDEVLKCLMPLTTPEAELDEGLDILEQAAAEVFGVADTYLMAPAESFAARQPRIPVMARRVDSGSRKVTPAAKHSKATLAAAKKHRGQNGQAPV
jgi:diaminobutyrate-2-oxoglutarate transaminase